MEPKSTQSSRATRSSLACLPCRSRHLKCDGKRPCCDRCSGTKNQCTYAQSRRGGLSRAALEERRQRLAEISKNRHVNHKNSATVIFRQSQDDLAPSQLDFPQEHPIFNLGAIATGDSFLQVMDTVPPVNIETDPLVDSYYKKFHICHPFVLPKHHLETLHQDPRRQQEFLPLIAAIRLVGNIYKERELSHPLKEHLEASISQAVASDPIIVQCRLLYSMALFWYEEKVDAKSQMDMANKLAIELQMFHCEFAVTQGADDLVLRESWRRTWWMLYIIEAYYAGTLGTMNFQVINIDATVELPCDEADYESGNIPASKTLHEFDCREFDPRDIHFSSFGYLIGAVQCAASAISATPTVVTAEDSTYIMQAADASLDGWLRLLPPDRKQVMNAAGEVDELMFQAHLVIHVSTIGLHRPLSALKFNAIESESSCAREPPIDTPISDSVNIHTIRVKRAIEAQIQLLALPVRQFHHTPFTTCMVSEGTLALLSDCSFLLKGRELAIARDQIRMTIGCLKTLGEFWPRTARNVEEIQKIAQCVLGLACGGNNFNSPGLSDTPSLGYWDSSTSDFSNNDIEMRQILGDMDLRSLDLCGWDNIN
ncbi:unnamed protein product [Penicillium salamii]|uniref:Zn(2)-C6 fungal-type domain-containing protein n=1 Tax=Penicillium salamii TaxID=1612424 RepID=A0A9W4NKX4_9EURO|nr:unnamed protein product [Penicillium salamii]CAG8067927.1 unnamed protein product [Penicillium salamii]CAG8075385.1 unnamed protein product [Penicillium salamii]CAG8175005.1 unnamed protein product [Penicillium salamii]CAG8225022.1 unnamed protein product [Penicillium salamii]